MGWLVVSTSSVTRANLALKRRPRRPKRGSLACISSGLWLTWYPIFANEESRRPYKRD